MADQISNRRIEESMKGEIENKIVQNNFKTCRARSTSFCLGRFEML